MGHPCYGKKMSIEGFEKWIDKDEDLKQKLDKLII